MWGGAVFVHSMGSSQSNDVALPALPQQQIVNMSDGRTLTSGPSVPVGAVGQRQQAVAVRQPLALQRGWPKLEPGGVVALEVAASVPGEVQLFAQALEVSSGSGMWPTITASRPVSSRSVAGGSKVVIRFDRPEELLQKVGIRQERGQNPEGGHTWPVLLILGPSQNSNAAGPVPDGTMMVGCVIRNGELVIARQIVAWGGTGTAYVMKELYGIQEAQEEGAGDHGKNCVVCLTNPKDTALMPCRHFCVCSECGTQLRLAPARNKCPLCRAAVEDIVRIDVAAQDESPGLQGASVARTVPGPVVEVAEVQREEAAPSAAPSTSRPSSSSSGARYSQRLARELRQIEAQKEELLRDQGIELSLSDEDASDMQVWLLRLHSKAFDESTELGRELRRSGASVIELEVFIPENFPLIPPQVRVLTPCFAPGSFFVHQHGALCLEILTTQGWTPAMPLLQLGLQIKNIMCGGTGSIVSCRRMGETGPAGREQAKRLAEELEANHSDWSAFDG